MSGLSQYQLKNENSTDVLLLVFVRVITILGNFISVAILSRALSLSDYGIYSAGNLIVSVASSVILLGFSDAGNYYYNLGKENRESYINTIFFLQFVMGLVCAAVIMIANGAITSYFHNPALKGMYIYLIFRPMLANMTVTLQPLQTAVGKARAIALWNLVVMLMKLAMVFITAYLTHDVLTVFIALLAVDIVSVVYYSESFRKNAFRIRWFRIDRTLIKEILEFSIPMGIYILANSLMKDTDKLVIGYFGTAEALAIYTNCSAQLPVCIISTAFLAVALPMITKSIQRSENAIAVRLCSAYLKIGYITTTILGMACIVLAPEAIKLLYGSKYLDGRGVFIAYVVVDMIRFANTTIVLTAKGRTKTLMAISITSLAVNAVLNIIIYKAVGFVGPAIATVIVSIATTYVLLKCSADTIETTVTGMLDLKCIMKLFAEIAVVGAAAAAIRSLMVNRDVNYVITLIAVGVLFCGVLFLLNLKEIKGTLKYLDNK